MRRLARSIRARGIAVLVLVLGCATPGWTETTSTPAAAPSATVTATASSPDDLKIPAGEHLVLELKDPLHTRFSRQGDTAHFATVNEVLAGSRLAIPVGSNVRATLTQVKRPGRVAGRAEIRLRFDDIELPDGTTLPFAANVLRAGFSRFGKGKSEPSLKGEGGKGRDLATVGMGGAQGALLGAIFGGAKGAAFGGAVGAGVGLLSVLLERGPHLDLAEGTLFEVELDKDLVIPASAAAQLARQTNPGAPPPAGSTSAGGFTFPGSDTTAENTEPPPEFGPEDAGTAPSATAPSATTTTTPTAPPPSAEPPAPSVLDPTLGDPDAYKLRVDVQLVMLEAYVRDRNGRPLDNLTRQDFRLFEDGAEQQIRHFSRDQLPLAVALVVDRSGSVAPYMPELRHAAYQTLSQLKPGDQVCLFAFASEVERLENLTTDRQRIADRIAHIRAGGGTNIVDAIFDAAYYLSVAAPDRRRAIILISDNQGTVRGQASQAEAIRLGLEGSVVVYSIKTAGEPLPFLLRLPTKVSGVGSVRRITEETGGEIIDLDEVGSLQAALAAVVSRLKLRYTLGYQPTNKARDGSFRKIDVRLADRLGSPQTDYAVHARRGYYAPQERVASQPADHR